MDDRMHVVNQDPLGMRYTFNMPRAVLVHFSDNFFYAVGNRLDLSRTLGAADYEKVANRIFNRTQVEQGDVFSFNFFDARNN